MEKPIRSLSGIRGIIGKTMTPLESYKTTIVFYEVYLSKSIKLNLYSKTLIIGRDSKQSGRDLLKGTLAALHYISDIYRVTIEPFYLGVTSAPALQWAVTNYNAIGGINFTASHNPIEWNGMKLISNPGDCASLLAPEIMAKTKQRIEQLDKHITDNDSDFNKYMRLIENEMWS